VKPVRTWGDYYHDIAQTMALYQQSNRQLVTMAELRPGMSVVDLACGSGLTTLAALAAVPEGLRIFMVDHDPAMIATARRLLGDRVVAYHQVDAIEAADLIGEQVDRVLCNMSMWQFANPEAVLRRWRSAIKPAGRLCFNLTGTYYNSGEALVSPQWAMLRALAQQGHDVLPVQELERLPNRRSIEGTLSACGFKPFVHELQVIPSTTAETAPGGELHSLIQLTPPLRGDSFQIAVEHSLTALAGVADQVNADRVAWRVAHFMSQPQVNPTEVLMAKFGGKLP